MSDAATVRDRPGRGSSREVRCGFCGEVFEEDRGQPACLGCPLSEACRYVRCPDCGYENPVTPGWVERLRSLWPAGAPGDRP